MEHETIFYRKNRFDQLSINVWKEHLVADFPVHAHDFSELVVITKGKGIHIIDNAEYTIQAGDVYVIKGNTTHGFKDIVDLTLYNIAYEAAEPILEFDYLRTFSGFQALFFVEPLYRKKMKFEHRLHLNPSDLMFAEKLLEIMCAENPHGNQYYRIQKIYLTSFMTFLARQYEINLSNNNISYISDILAYIEQNYMENFIVEEFAAKMHLSVRHFTRIFSETYGVTPKQYILKLRLQHACNSLRSSHKSIAQIASESGFEDTNYFSTYFTKKMGMTPKDYRLANHDSNNVR